MAREIKLMEYLPQYLQAYKELQEIQNSLSQEVQNVENAQSNLLSNQFIMSCDEQGISKFENMLGISKFDNDTLDERKFRVLSVWNNSIPYTYRVLVERLNALIGASEYTMQMQYELYTLIVKVALTSKRNLSDVSDLLSKLVPSNVVITLQLLYNNHEMLGVYTHGQLSAKTHFDIREEVL